MSAKSSARPFLPIRALRSSLARDRRSGGNNRRAPAGRLDRRSKLLLAVNGLFGAANALSGTFVNVYLWKTSHDLALIGWFAVATHLANAATFVLAGKWVKEKNNLHSLRLGVGLSALFYLAVLMLGERAARFVLPLGAVQGMAFGFFWLAFNVVYFEVTGPDDRDRFNGWAGLIGSLSGMVAPWASGLIITRMADTQGYRVIFAVSLAVFLIGAVLSFFLRRRAVHGKYDWTYGFVRMRRKGSPWRSIVPALMSQGVREGVFAFLIGLMVYMATQDEAKVGDYWLITSAVGLISFWLGGKFIRQRFRSPVMFIGAAAMVAVIFPFFLDVNYATLLIFGIGTALAMPLFTIPMTSTVFDTIGRDRDSAEHRVEYVVLRELGLTLGRLLGTLAFIAVVARDQSAPVLNWTLFAIGLFPFFTWLFMRSLLRRPVRPGEAS
jgi:YQGE family putative transporter